MDNNSSFLISCIMPTFNRRAFVPHAIRYFLRQDYPHKELIIIDDGTDSLEDLVPGHDMIRYFRLPQKITLGAKLNMACEMARGNIIANWDDDDWYAPNRLSSQADIMKNEQIFVCGINKLLYYDLSSKKGFQYIYPADQRTWLLGSSQCYRKDFWARNRFADINVGMDGLFVWSTTDDHIKVMPGNRFAIHMIHSSNISPKQTNTNWWHPHPVEDIRGIMGNDWQLYSINGSQPLAFDIDGNNIETNRENETVKPVTNLYACLVHENEDCIIDLVRNLHYYDPVSPIILYNGGTNTELLDRCFPYQKFGAVICPDPVPVQWGFLHHFALNCMKFALDNFSFTTFTIVDSDQLCVKKGYTKQLVEYLHLHPGTGMLSNKPEKISPGDRTNPVALQAYSEYELWRPLLKSFPDGENKFVHWTFWPSSVFTASAVKDLVKVFNENKLLQDIMAETKIWATEEVILPMLVKLLGYEIGLNPCSYDFVKYKVQFNAVQAVQAVNQQGVYWIHPVSRKYDDTVRNVIRQHSDQYTKSFEKTEVVVENKAKDTSYFLSLNKNIEGWLTDKEAELLINSVAWSAKVGHSKKTIVEIGSYQGKATVLLGAVVSEMFPQSKVYAIDPHEGKLGAADTGFVFVEPSIEKLRININKACLQSHVEIIKDHAVNVKWNKKISLLLIDGLHDYPNVAKDFWHFSGWVVPGGCVAFHDYADYFPGVMSFVQELISSGEYETQNKVDSLMILKRKGTGSNHFTRQPAK